ncbi:hypothetical protein JM84_0878 [Dokdonia sp. Hel_I_63]|uniref:hypothetical protein n=1 Tax=unclassified Dokdonia TaxID=2615033 RepID=UPI00020A7A6E|nr:MULTISPECIES: hypothetical protein [unclassified Dokdonia]AEE18776.1 hypothetical protein Krodi_0792 [Dokdonia sp. 4H-3-7-5]TVZ21996.1 hypothetical protein JM84_0878 [Dokdonia sp. Hel_I_63]
MKRIFLSLTLVALLGTSFTLTSCRENKTVEVSTDNDDVEDAMDDVEDAMDDAGDAIEEGVDEIKENTGTGGTDDN